MNKLVKYLLLLLVPLLSIAVLNIFLDSRSYFTERYAVNLASNLNTGDLSIFKEPSLRIVKRELIKHNAGKHYDKVIVGSSRTMHLGGNSDKYLNISVPGAVFEDYDILINLLEQESISYDTIVICADQWFFNKNHGDVRYKAFNNTFSIDSIKYAFSWKYFWDNILPDKYKKWDGNDNDFVIYKNGTVRFDKSYRTYIPDVSKYVSNAMREAFQDFYVIDENYKKWFEDLLRKVSNGHIVELFILPYHPDVYNELIKRIPVTNEIENLYYSYKSENINVFGSYDPHKLNLNNGDFYDANHMRSESLERLYKQKPIR